MKSLVVLFLCLCAVTVHAQSEPVRAYMAGTPDGRILEGRNATLDLSRGLLLGTDRDGLPVEIWTSELSYLSVSRGSKTLQSAALGGVAGALVALGAVVSVAADPDAEVDSTRVAPVTFGLAAVGAVIGAIVGSNQDAWEAVDIQGVSAAPAAPGSIALLSVGRRF